MTAEKVEQMQVYLANLHILYQKYRNYHWNIKGPHFIELHKFFEEQYDQIGEHIDVVAERIRMLDEFPKSSLKDYLQITTLEEDEIQTDEKNMLPTLIADTDKIIAHSKEVVKLCEDDNDPGNADELTAILETFEKTRWMLKSLSGN